MSNVEKIIDKMKRQPNGIRPEEVVKESLCGRHSQQNYIIERK